MALTALPISVTSVGATGADVNWADEVAVPFSGGGFSNYFPRPFYQEAAVGGYLALLGSNDTGLYNAFGRGFPDISAFSVEYATVVDGAYQGATGTSCSTPVWASVVALLNDERLRVGKPVLGFLNPWLYAKAAGALTDIVKGNNKECLESDGTVAGFIATPGWDPVSSFACFFDLARLHEFLWRSLVWAPRCTTSCAWQRGFESCIWASCSAGTIPGFLLTYHRLLRSWHLSVLCTSRHSAVLGKAFTLQKLRVPCALSDHTPAQAAP